MSIETKIINLIEPALNSLGYELVRVKQIGNDVLQILIDSEQGIGIDECTKATKLIKNILHVSEMGDIFNLEVSSPGLDRPLLKPDHFKKFIGNDVKLNTSILIDGQKRFIGKLTDFNQETQQITLTCDDKIVTIEFNQMQSTNLYYK
jgi:ribosome maturation factor RimP